MGNASKLFLRPVLGTAIANWGNLWGGRTQDTKQFNILLPKPFVCESINERIYCAAGKYPYGLKKEKKVRHSELFKLGVMPSIYGKCNKIGVPSSARSCNCQLAMEKPVGLKGTGHQAVQNIAS
ncbi:hypothetical protein ACROYT_G003681 [Oculina patagonica]